MCMILDANKWGDFLKEKPDMKPVHTWINNRRGRIICSKYPDIDKEMMYWIKKWQLKRDQARKKPDGIQWISPKKVEEAVKKTLPALQKQKKWTIQSDDPHILALAKASGAKLLCSNDGPLRKDFEKLITNGKVYKRGLKRKQQQGLLSKAVCP